MKRRFTLMIALVLSIGLVMLMTDDSQAQGNRRAVFDSGMVTLAPNQLLRLTLTPPQGNNISLNYEEIKIAYLPGPCNNGVCKLSASTPQSSRGQIDSGEAVSIDIMPSGAAVRGVIRTNNRNARVNMMIIDTATGNIVSLSDDVIDSELNL